MSDTTFRREIVFTAAFDKRNSDPSKNYGVHGVDMRWYLHGPKGVIQFVVYTNWHLPHVAAAWRGNSLNEPLPADVGYHSPVPTYEGETPLKDSCELLGGRPCYYDGSGLQAEELFNLLVREGSEPVWKRLEETYHHRLEREDKP